MQEATIVLEEKDFTPGVGTALEVGDHGKVQDDPKAHSGMHLSKKDYGWLRKTEYEEKRWQYKKTFVLQHKKYPSKVVELRAATAVQACRFIHWKPNQVRVIEVREGHEEVVKAVTPPPAPVLSGTSGLV